MKKKTIKIILAIVLVITLVVGTGISIQLYRLEVRNFTSKDSESHGIYIYPNTPIDSVTTMLLEHYDIASIHSWQHNLKRYSLRQPKPGYYKLPVQFGDKHFIRRLQLGEESPIKLAFNNSLRTNEQLAKHFGERLLIDSAEIAERFNDNEYLKQFGFNKETVKCMFIPNTYQVYWTISVDKLFQRFLREYNTFWTDARREQAMSKGLTPVETAILASIVESETHNKAEHPAIASLYLNRLHKGMHLQACPTAIYASGNFKLRRVLKRHLAIDSPYNTYKYAGLPPGPIRTPYGSTIDSVLSAPKTDYLYMCANPDFSGTHIFSSTYRIHSRAAKQYQRELNNRKIR